MGKYKLNIVADALSLPEFNHHRASDDAITCGYLMMRFWKMLDEQGVHTLSAVNPRMAELRAGGRIFDRRAKHIIVLAKNSIGLRNLYRLISYGNLKYFKRVPDHAEVGAFKMARGTHHRLCLRGGRALPGRYQSQELGRAQAHRGIL